MNNTDVVSPECSCKPGNLDELLAQLIAQHARLFLLPLALPPPPTLVAGGALPEAAPIHASQDRPTFPRGVNGQLIDTVCLNGIYEMAPPHTCREAWLAAGAAQIAPVQGRGISHPGKNAVLDRVSIDRPAWRDAR